MQGFATAAISLASALAGGLVSYFGARKVNQDATSAAEQRLRIQLDYDESRTLRDTRVRAYERILKASTDSQQAAASIGTNPKRDCDAAVQRRMMRASRSVRRALLSVEVHAGDSVRQAAQRLYEAQNKMIFDRWWEQTDSAQRLQRLAQLRTAIEKAEQELLICARDELAPGSLSRQPPA